MSTIERRHRCGGTLRPSEVQIRDDTEGVLMVYAVPGLVCDRCHEELIDQAAMIEIERKSQTPTIVWFPSGNVPATSLVTEPIFNAPANSTALVAA